MSRKEKSAMGLFDFMDRDNGGSRLSELLKPRTHCGTGFEEMHSPLSSALSNPVSGTGVEGTSAAKGGGGTGGGTGFLDFLDRDNDGSKLDDFFKMSAQLAGAGMAATGGLAMHYRRRLGRLLPSWLGQAP